MPTVGAVTPTPTTGRVFSRGVRTRVERKGKALKRFVSAAPFRVLAGDASVKPQRVDIVNLGGVLPQVFE
jgi:hypothetical protein